MPLRRNRRQSQNLTGDQRLLKFQMGGAMAGLPPGSATAHGDGGREDEGKVGMRGGGGSGD